MRRSLLTGSYQPSGAISFITKRLSTLVRSTGLRSRSIQNHHERFPHQKRKPKRLVNVKTQRRAERGTNDVNQFAHNAGQHFPYSNEVSRSLIRRGWIGNHGLSAYTIQPGNVRTVLFPLDDQIKSLHISVTEAIIVSNSQLIVSNWRTFFGVDINPKVKALTMIERHRSDSSPFFALRVNTDPNVGRTTCASIYKFQRSINGLVG